LWKEIYKWEGYYINWTEKQVSIFARERLEKFEKYHILTSNGTQRRYLNIAKTRPLLTVIKEYLLESTNSFIKEENIKLAKFSTFKNSIISINSIFL